MRLKDPRPGGWEYMVHFYHEPAPQGPVSRRKRRRKTVCTLHAGPCTVNARPCQTQGAITATATGGGTDEFTRAAGRKVAFTKAMALLGLDRATRRELWADYFARTGLLLTRTAAGKHLLRRP